MMATLGGYGETLVLGNLAILLADNVVRSACCVKKNVALARVRGRFWTVHFSPDFIILCRLACGCSYGCEGGRGEGMRLAWPGF